MFMGENFIYHELIILIAASIVNTKILSIENKCHTC